MRSRMLTLILAVVTGAVAVAIVYAYVQQVEDETARGQRMVDVLVSNTTLPAGTTGPQIISSGAAATQRIPDRYVATGALGSLDQLRSGVLSQTLGSNQQLTRQAFESSQSNAFTAQFKEGTQGLAVSVERVRGVGGHIAAGDRLNAFETRDQGGTEVIAEQVEVIEVQPAAEGDPAGLDMMVLQVTQSQALDLINAQEQAGLWFTLIPPGGGQ